MCLQRLTIGCWVTFDLEANGSLTLAATMATGVSMLKIGTQAMWLPSTTFCKGKVWNLLEMRIQHTCGSCPLG